MLGPIAGNTGGRVVYFATPAEVAKTVQFVSPVFGQLLNQFQTAHADYR